MYPDLPSGWPIVSTYSFKAARLLQLLYLIVEAGRVGKALCDASLDVIKNLLLLRLVAVQFKAERPKAGGIEATSHNFECCEFFSDEQDRLTGGDGGGD